MTRNISLSLAWAISTLLFSPGGFQHASADEPKISNWNGYEQRSFVVDGRNALVVVPKQAAEGKPWIWRTEFFGHEPQGDIALLGHGFHVAYIDVQNMYGAPVALDHMDKFYEQLVKEYGLSKKVVLEGFSRGGLFSLNWAARNPDKVACIYNDAPVCDFKSWPGGKGKSKRSGGDWQRCLQAYGLTEEQALEYKLNPVDNLEPLAKAKIPLLHVCGAADDVVPIEENTRLLEERYLTLGGPITVISKPGNNHHPHSLKDPAIIVAFVLKHTGQKFEPAIWLDSPSEYEVFQHATAKHAANSPRGAATNRDQQPVNQTPISLRGVAIKRDGELEEWLLPGENSPMKASGGAVSLDEHTNRFDVKLEAPDGGWYRVDLHVKQDGKSLTMRSVEHVGVGEVFIVAGQSNSANHGSEKQKPASGMVAAFDGAKWQLANDPQPGASGGGGSFMPAFGDAMYAKYHVPIGIVAVGVGSSSVREWLPKGERMKNQPTTGANVKAVGEHEWESTGVLYDRLADRLKTLGPHGCRAVLWHQGESDAGQARSGYPADRQITGDQYRSFMETLIHASRKSAEWDVPWFVAQATFHSEKDAEDEEFRAAQKSLWKDGLALEGPDSDALRGDLRDGVHFKGPGLQAHGKAWAEKVGVWLDKELKPTP